MKNIQCQQAAYYVLDFAVKTVFGIKSKYVYLLSTGPFNGICYTNGTTGYEPRTNGVGDSNKLARGNSRKDLTPLMNAANKLDTEEKKQLQQQTPWYGKSPDEGVECDEGNHTADEDEDRRVVLQLKREGTVKDLTQKLTAQNLIPNSPVEEKVSRLVSSGFVTYFRLYNYTRHANCFWFWQLQDRRRKRFDLKSKGGSGQVEVEGRRPQVADERQLAKTNRSQEVGERASLGGARQQAQEATESLRPGLYRSQLGR